jgi:glycosyltransferase involved in cell wall biosynthesis
MADRKNYTHPSIAIKPGILMIGNHLPVSSGNINFWHYLAERLRLNNWEIITTSSKTDKFMRLLDMLTTIWRRRKEYSLAQIDVFSGQAFIFAYLSGQLLSLIGKPFVLTLHGGGLPEFFQKYPKPIRHLFSNAAEIVTPSGYMREAFRSVRADIRLIPNPIEVTSARFRVRETAAANLIWVRAFHSVYNPQMAVRVLKTLVDHGFDAHLIMLGPNKGDGSQAETLQLAKNLNVDQVIHVVGGVPHKQIPDWLDKADIFINTTNYDTAPRSVLEAMANGLCVVSTNVGGIPFLLKDEVDCLLVAPNDHEAMANAIMRILAEPQLSEKLSANARKSTEEFDWSTILPQWEKLFAEVIEKETD